MTLRVLCDTNVLVSALIADGPPSRLLVEAIDCRLELVLPDIVLAELERVLRAKLGFSADDARSARDFLASLATELPPAPGNVEPVSGVPADDAILAAAVEVSVDVVATGDRKHLLPLGQHEGVRLLTPQAVLAELRGHERRA